MFSLEQRGRTGRLMLPHVGVRFGFLFYFYLMCIGRIECILLSVKEDAGLKWTKTFTGNVPVQV